MGRKDVTDSLEGSFSWVKVGGGRDKEGGRGDHPSHWGVSS